MITQPTIIDSYWGIGPNDTLTIRNDGITTHGELMTTGSGRIVNDGTFINFGLADFEGFRGLENHGLFQNYGETTGEGQIVNFGTIENFGSMEHEDYSPLENHGTFENYGDLIFQSSGGLDNRGTLTNHDSIRSRWSGSFSNAGLIINNPWANISINDGPVSNFGLIQNHHNFVFQDSAFVNEGTIETSFGFHLDERAELSGNGNIVIHEKQFIVLGPMTAPELVIEPSAPEFLGIEIYGENAAIDAGPKFSLDPGPATGPGEVNYLLVQESGRLIADDIFIGQSAYLLGVDGVVIGDTKVAGELFFGHLNFGAGGIDIVGALSLFDSSVLSTQIRGFGPDDLDMLTVSEKLTLDGTLIIGFDHLVLPKPGDTFTIFLAQTVEGNFDSFDFPQMDGLDFSFSVVSGAGILSVAAAPTPVPSPLIPTLAALMLLSRRLLMKSVSQHKRGEGRGQTT